MPSEEIITRRDTPALPHAATVLRVAGAAHLHAPLGLIWDLRILRHRSGAASGRCDETESLCVARLRLSEARRVHQKASGCKIGWVAGLAGVERRGGNARNRQTGLGGAVERDASPCSQ